MLDIFETDLLKKYTDLYHNFIQSEVLPREKELMAGSFKDHEAGPLKELRTLAKNQGLWAPHLSNEEGGLGFNLMEFAQISEILAFTPFGHYIFNCQAPDIGNMELMARYASEELKAQFLEPLHAGEIRSCFSMTEPQYAGSNPVRMGTVAVKQGSDYVINGHKWFTSSADGAAFAVVMAVTDPEHENPYKRASMIVVPTDNPGFEFVRNISIMGEEGSGYNSHAEVKYNNCVVPASNLIHEEGTGFMLAQERLGPGRIHHCMRWIGICERALHMMCERAAQRELKHGAMLGEKQTIQNWIAESRAEINAARLMVLHTAHSIEVRGAKASREEISTIKFYVAGILQTVLDRAIQTHGALGITDDTVLSWWYRHERGARIYDGPDEVHKSVLARSILGKYGLNIK